MAPARGKLQTTGTSLTGRVWNHHKVHQADQALLPCLMLSFQWSVALKEVVDVSGKQDLISLVYLHNDGRHGHLGVQLVAISM